MRTFESQWEAKDGTSFFAQGWEPEKKKPKAFIGLIHGLGDHTSRFTHVGHAMTEAAYAMAGFDLRGHGRSGGARGHAPSLDAYMQDIRRFFQEMTPRYPQIPHFLYGHSLGGLLVLAYAIQYGSGLRGVMVTGAALRDFLQEQKAKLALVKLLAPILPTMSIHSGLDMTALSHDPAIIEAYRNDPLVHYSVTPGFGRAGLDAIDLCFARAKEFPVPLLMIHGKADKITYPSGSAEFANLVREAGGDVTLKLWDDLYHEVHNEPEKAEVFRFMTEWLEKHI
jgi:alpha-beta hydrolase superfamily lysophospholipase